MTAKIIDGKQLAESILAEIKQKTQTLKVKPALAIILVGEDPSSKIYVAAKEKACNKVGISCQVVNVPQDTLESGVIKIIKGFNINENINGIIVQLPLPVDLDKDRIIAEIEPTKDVDGLTENSKYKPATAKAVMKILEHIGIDLKGKPATVIGRSKLVGQPVAKLLRQAGCEVTVCHTQTLDLRAETSKADILVSAVGKKDLVTADMVKKDAVVIDVGISRSDGKVCGDVSLDAREVAGYITPVPGGVGPLTVACLLENVTIS